jgi:hypothetical protein
MRKLTDAEENMLIEFAYHRLAAPRRITAKQG